MNFAKTVSKNAVSNQPKYTLVVGYKGGEVCIAPIRSEDAADLEFKINRKGYSSHEVVYEHRNRAVFERFYRAYQEDFTKKIIAELEKTSTKFGMKYTPPSESN